MPVHLTAETIKEIAEELDMGMICFYHIPTGVLESIPDEAKGNLYDEEIWQPTIDKIEEDRASYLRFKDLDSHDTFQVMRSFVEAIKESAVRRRFEDALSYRKPFQNFRQLMDQYFELRQQWFAYQLQQKMDWVREQADQYNPSGERDDPR